LNEDEVSLFVQQFKHILNYFSILDEVNTEGVLPAYQISNNPSIPRKDVVEPSLPLDDLMSNVPDKKNNQIAIPRVHFDE
jgi:aspartyl-tRNA(Asn)/glutamyl-tRNA(Gln) amidotransferase subunit C